MPKDREQLADPYDALLLLSVEAAEGALEFGVTTVARGIANDVRHEASIIERH